MAISGAPEGDSRDIHQAGGVQEKTMNGDDQVETWQQANRFTRSGQAKQRIGAANIRLAFGAELDDKNSSGSQAAHQFIPKRQRQLQARRGRPDTKGDIPFFKRKEAAPIGNIGGRSGQMKRFPDRRYQAESFGHELKRPLEVGFRDLPSARVQIQHRRHGLRRANSLNCGVPPKQVRSRSAPDQVEADLRLLFVNKPQDAGKLQHLSQIGGRINPGWGGRRWFWPWIHSGLR